MAPERLARAEATAVIVSSASQSGASLCIPGTRETGIRVTPHVAAAADGTPAAVAGARPAPDDVEEREYQRAGGGAPGERDTKRGATVFERLLRFLR